MFLVRHLVAVAGAEGHALAGGVCDSIQVSSPSFLDDLVPTRRRRAQLPRAIWSEEVEAAPSTHRGS